MFSKKDALWIISDHAGEYFVILLSLKQKRDEPNMFNEIQNFYPIVTFSFFFLIISFVIKFIKYFCTQSELLLNLSHFIRPLQICSLSHIIVCQSGISR